MAEGGQIKPLRDLASRVRELTLREIEKVLINEGGTVDKEFRKAVILKLATNVLPRINEHSGPDGGAIEVLPILGGVTKTNVIPEDQSGRQDTSA